MMRNLTTSSATLYLNESSSVPMYRQLYEGLILPLSIVNNDEARTLLAGTPANGTFPINL